MSTIMFRFSRTLVALLILACTALIGAEPGDGAFDIVFPFDRTVFSPATGDSIVYVWADVNKDGKPDLVCAGTKGQLGSGGSFGVAVYLNTGTNLATTPAWFALSAGNYLTDRVTDIALGDYDGDGDLDIACGFGGFNAGRAPVIYKNMVIENGTAGGSLFSASPIWTGGSALLVRKIAFSDVNADGRQDLVIVKNNPAGVQFFLNNNGTLPTAPSKTIADPTPTGGATCFILDMALGDIDKDGDMDIALEVYPSGFDHYVAVYKNNAGTFAELTRFGNRYGPIAFGDIDGDGDVDLVGPTYVFDNAGGTFGTAPITTLNAITFDERMFRISLGDFDRDGDLDMAVSQQDPGTLVVVTHAIYINDGGRLLPEPVWQSSENEGTVSAVGPAVSFVDFNGDGILDLAAGKGIFLLQPLLHDNVRPEPPTFLRAASATPNRTDVTVTWTASTSSDATQYRIYDGNGVFSTSRQIGTSTGTSFVHAAGPGLHSYFITTVDQAGNESLAAGPVNIGSLALTSVKGDGAPEWSTFSKTSLLGDLNGDGKTDILTQRVYTGPFTGGSEWAILTNSGAGVFTETWTRRPSPGVPLSLADVNGDGRPDVLVLAYAQVAIGGGLFETRGGVALYLNTNNSFAASPVWQATFPADAALSGYDVAWGDMDGDGDLDLAISGAGAAGKAVVYKNNGGGVFSTAPVWSSVEPSTYGVAFGDFDKDGDADLAVADLNASKARATLYKSSGGSLSTTSTWTVTETNTGTFPTPKLSWFDYNKDGWLDLTIHSPYTYLYSNNSGVMSTASLEEYPFATIKWADLDNDGDADLIGAKTVYEAVPSTDAGPIPLDIAFWHSDFFDERWSQFLNIVDVVDLDGDGVKDFITNNNFSSMVFLRKTGGIVSDAPLKVTRIVVTPSPINLVGSGATQAMTVTATFSDNSQRNVTGETIFSISTADASVVATVSGNVVKAVANGTAQINANFGTAGAAIFVNVTGVAPAPVSISISPKNATLNGQGEALIYTVTATLDNGLTQDVTSASTITSSNSNAAVMNGNVASAVANGVSTISAAYQGFNASTPLNVAITRTVTSLSINPASKTIKVGDKQGFEVRATYSDGSVETVTFQASLTSSNTTVAGTSGNQVEGLSAGTATVTATFQSRTAQVAITVQGSSNAGDLNNDKVVNIDDLVLVTSHFGQTSTSTNWDVRADANGDNVVNIQDLTAVTANFGRTYP